MAYTPSDLDTIDAAILSENLTVRVAGREVTRRSIDELLQVRAHVAAALAQQTAPNRATPRFQVATFADD